MAQTTTTYISIGGETSSYIDREVDKIDRYGWLHPSVLIVYSAKTTNDSSSNTADSNTVDSNKVSSKVDSKTV